MALEPASIGRHHPLLAEFRRAFRAGLLPQPSGVALLALEGPRLLAEALRSGLHFEHVLFSRTGLAQLGPKLLPQLSKHTQLAQAEDAAFAAAMDSEHPQGVAALARFAPANPAALFEPAPALVLVAAGLQDPGNLGTLIRSADAFGATGVAALADTVSPFNPKAVRASAGSLFHLPVLDKLPAADLVAACRERGVALLATAARGEDLTSAAATAALRQPCALVIGQEGAGVPRALQRSCQLTLAVPMARPVDSLNAGVAGALLLYEAARQRRPNP